MSEEYHKIQAGLNSSFREDKTGNLSCFSKPSMSSFERSFVCGFRNDLKSYFGYIGSTGEIGELRDFAVSRDSPCFFWNKGFIKRTENLLDKSSIISSKKLLNDYKNWLTGTSQWSIGGSRIFGKFDCLSEAIYCAKNNFVEDRAFGPFAPTEPDYSTYKFEDKDETP